MRISRVRAATPRNCSPSSPTSFFATTPVTGALHKETSTVPIVFTLVSDPLGGGFVAGLPHPCGNITGFVHTDGALGGKWLTC